MNPSEIIFAAVPSPPDERDFPPSAIVPDWAAVELVLPDRARAADVPSPYDQDGKPACVGESAAGDQTIEERLGLVRFDGEELYAACKQQDGAPSSPGTYIRVAASIRLNRGMYATSGTTKGQLHRIGSYARLPLTFLDFETAIFTASAQASPRVGGSPWVCGNWPSNWFSVPSSGLLPKPIFAASAQGHAFKIVEYWRTSPWGRVFRILNSWGLGFGQNGEAWVRYDDLMAVLWEGWKTTEGPDPLPLEIVITPYDVPKLVTVHRGLLTGYNAAGQTKTHLWWHDSRCHGDALVTVTGPYGTKPPRGQFVRIVDGFYAGFWVLTSKVTIS